MPYLETDDGTRLHSVDWGDGPTMVFSHGWAVGADMWEYQLVPLSDAGFRCVAFDRRGCGRSDQPGHGYDFDTLADDLATVLTQLDLTDVTFVAHSMAAGELTRYLVRHGAGRIARVALVAPTTPCLRRYPDNPAGIDAEVQEATFAGLSEDRPAWLSMGARLFFGADRPGGGVSEAMVDWGISLALRASAKATIEMVRTFTVADLRPDMGAFTMPTLVIHGDADQIAPIELTGVPTAAAIPNSELRIYEGASHGLFVTDRERLNADLVAFTKEEA